MQVQVFAQQGHFTAKHNALYDVVLPRVGGNAWKLLDVILRQTKGWNRETVSLSLKDFIRLSGIKAENTVIAGLKELREFEQDGKPTPLIIEARSGNTWEPTRYSLNFKAKLIWVPTSETTEMSTSIFEALPTSKNDVPTSKNDVLPTSKNDVPTSKNDALPTSKNDVLIRNETKKKKQVRIASLVSPSAKPGRKADPLFEIFAEAFQRSQSCPYLHKEADFVQLAALRKKSSEKNWSLTEERFTQSVGNYFASEIGNPTLADLCVRFSAFFKSPLDRFGHSIGGGNSRKSTLSKSEQVHQHNMALVEQLNRETSSNYITAEVIND